MEIAIDIDIDKNDFNEIKKQDKQFIEKKIFFFFWVEQKLKEKNLIYN